MEARASTSRMTSVPQHFSMMPARELTQATSHGFPMGAHPARELGMGGRGRDDRGLLSRRCLAGKAQQFHLDALSHGEGAELDHAL
jgi:hypothetical protein